MAIELLERPELCPGAYSLHLYCKYKNPAHEVNEFPHEPTQCQTRGEAVTMARGWGWLLHRDGTATCPKCSRGLAMEAIARQVNAASVPSTRNSTRKQADALGCTVKSCKSTKRKT